MSTVTGTRWAKATGETEPGASVEVVWPPVDYSTAAIVFDGAGDAAGKRVTLHTEGGYSGWFEVEDAPAPAAAPTDEPGGGN